MSEVLSWAISALVALLLAAFAWAVASYRALPTFERPRTRTFDCLGRFVELAENPDYHENPGEDPGEDPAQQIVAGRSRDRAATSARER